MDIFLIFFFKNFGNRFSSLIFHLKYLLLDFQNDSCELLQFARLYPLDQKDLAPALRSIDFGVPIPSGVEVETSASDYTPPQYLTLLFTDLGVLTPSVVSDELIQLYL